MYKEVLLLAFSSGTAAGVCPDWPMSSQGQCLGSQGCGCSEFVQKRAHVYMRRHLKHLPCLISSLGDGLFRCWFDLEVKCGPAKGCCILQGFASVELLSEVLGCVLSPLWWPAVTHFTGALWALFFFLTQFWLFLLCYVLTEVPFDSFASVFAWGVNVRWQRTFWYCAKGSSTCKIFPFKTCLLFMSKKIITRQHTATVSWFPIWTVLIF